MRCRLSKGIFTFPHFQIHNLLFRLRLQFLSFLYSVFNGSYQVEGCFRVFIHFPVHNHIETADGIFQAYKYAFQTGKLFGYMERLRKETLYTACTLYR